MPRYRRQYKRRGHSSRYDPYSEARRHIEEAQELTHLLGGTDQTVKEYFFNLPQPKLDKILKQYGQLYGELPEEYAVETMPKWRSGTVKMSGMVAERLYKLLPPTMPLQDKFNIAEELWKHVGPSSRKSLRFGQTTSYVQITKTINDYITEVVQSYRIPEELQQRFNWLSGGDITVQQQLLNHLLSLDKKTVIEAANLQAKSMLTHLSGAESNFTQHYSHTVKVGKHELQLIADREVQGCRVENYIAPTHVTQQGNPDSKGESFSIPGWCWWLAIPVLFALLRIIGD